MTSCECFYKSWRDFKADYEDFLPRLTSIVAPGRVFSSYAFRGQANAEWQLTATFDRRMTDKRLKAREQRASEWLSTFESEVARYYGQAQESEEHRLLSLAQHYGLPTRLLDWSFSPYIAAYFAFAGAISNQDITDVAIWALSIDILQDQVHQNQVDIIKVNDYTNERLRNQRGLFTYLKTDDIALDDFVWNRTWDNDKPPLFKYYIDAGEAPHALKDLMLMDIHPVSLFPGYEGIARYTMLLHALEDAE